MFNMLSQFIADEAGATAIEYGIIASGIVVAIIAAIALLSSNTSDVFNYVSSQASSALKS